MKTLFTRLPYIHYMYMWQSCVEIKDYSIPEYPIPTHHPSSHLPYTSPSPPHTPCSLPHDSPAAAAGSCHAHGLGRGGVVDRYNGTGMVLYIATKHVYTLSEFTQALSTCAQKNLGLNSNTIRLVLAIDRPLHKTLQRRV